MGSLCDSVYRPRKLHRRIRGYMMFTPSSDSYVNYGFPHYMDGNEIKLWMGADKDNTTQSFKWQAPEWAVGNVDYSICDAVKPKVENRVFVKGQITWANGQPDMTPGKDCTYLTYKYKLEFPSYGFYTARCDNEVADGFACGNLQTNLRGIPLFQKTADEYGINPPDRPTRQGFLM
ncbi:hypothetical protein GCK72_003439 [Caenorhabditis remanei]|uniref:Uncharacterized protein n=1 Tax=Caenorhabditis remanei TaxID=31234 RepID=A0A6A5HYX2_CAERE|nr:hypothetical protein GCK72_003439 [Caenorhabditis remanei]KAF1771612.1 hypothetical protein GCK72_003439 [Caenorhabditis remanei]